MVLNDWYFNPAGTGFAGAQQVNEYLDINGNAFIQLAPTGPNTFSFQEFGVFNSVQADSNGQLFPLNYGQNITAVFNASGTGVFGGAFSFSSGSFSVYADPNNNYGTASPTSIYGANDGTKIAEFEVFGGGGLVDASGLPIANGQITLFARLVDGSMASGYFFDPSGNDISLGTVLAFAFTNANTVGSPSAVMVSEIICEGAGFAGPGCDGMNPYANNAPQYFFVSNNGQFKLAIPEPGSLALLGVAMLGLGLARRRRAA